jgi:hypothetical protein
MLEIFYLIQEEKQSNKHSPHLMDLKHINPLETKDIQIQIFKDEYLYEFLKE